MAFLFSIHIGINLSYFNVSLFLSVYDTFHMPTMMSKHCINFSLLHIPSALSRFHIYTFVCRNIFRAPMQTVDFSRAETRKAMDVSNDINGTSWNKNLVIRKSIYHAHTSVYGRIHLMGRNRLQV